MAYTTKENIVLIAPELSVLSDELFNLIIADVNTRIDVNVFGTQIEIAARYLSAHLLTMASGLASGISPSGMALKGEKAGRESKTYGSVMSGISGMTRYDTTKYGMMFMNLAISQPDTIYLVV